MVCRFIQGSMLDVICGIHMIKYKSSSAPVLFRRAK